MSLQDSWGLGHIGRSTPVAGWLRRNLIFDNLTIAILAFVIILTLVVFAATTTFSSTGCQTICQVQPG
jgi:hypothetical protein